MLTKKHCEIGVIIIPNLVMMKLRFKGAKQFSKITYPLNSRARALLLFALISKNVPYAPYPSSSATLLKIYAITYIC